HLLNSSAFLFNIPVLPLFYSFSLHDALPISSSFFLRVDLLFLNCSSSFPVLHKNSNSNSTLPMRETVSHNKWYVSRIGKVELERSEEHTSELQSPDHLVCRLLLEKKKHRSR